MSEELAPEAATLIEETLKKGGKSTKQTANKEKTPLQVNTVESVSEDVLSNPQISTSTDTVNIQNQQNNENVGTGNNESPTKIPEAPKAKIKPHSTATQFMTCVKVLPIFLSALLLEKEGLEKQLLFRKQQLDKSLRQLEDKSRQIQDLEKAAEEEKAKDQKELEKQVAANMKQLEDKSKQLEDKSRQIQDLEKTVEEEKAKHLKELEKQVAANMKLVNMFEDSQKECQEAVKAYQKYEDEIAHLKEIIAAYDNEDSDDESENNTEDGSQHIEKVSPSEELYNIDKEIHQQSSLLNSQEQPLTGDRENNGADTHVGNDANKDDGNNQGGNVVVAPTTQIPTEEIIELKAVLAGKEAIISKLHEDLKRALNAESYFAYKLAKWKDIGISNKLRNFELAQDYLDLESLCTDLRAKLVEYEERIFAQESLVNKPKQHMAVHVMLCTIIAICGSLMLGYDFAVSGGLLSVDCFLYRFFPQIFERQRRMGGENYERFIYLPLSLFSGTAYLMALFSSPVRLWMCERFGLRATIQVASIFFIMGGGICFISTYVSNVIVLIIGRIITGIGIGLSHQVIPVFLKKILPKKYESRVDVGCHILSVSGGFLAYLMNYATSWEHECSGRHSWGPEVLLPIGLLVSSLFVCEIPGMDNTSIFEEAKSVEGIKDHFREVSRPLPVLVISVAAMIFQELMGSIATSFFLPAMFNILGFEDKAQLLASGISTLLQFLGVAGSIYLIKEFGRKQMLILSCFFMIVSQGATGLIIQIYLKSIGPVESGVAFAVIGFLCVFILGYASSFGPLGWLRRSFPMKTMLLGGLITTDINLVMSLFISELFIVLLRYMHGWIFLGFAGFGVAMMLFIVLLLPESEDKSIQDMDISVWEKHWFWRKFPHKNHYTCASARV